MLKDHKKYKKKLIPPFLDFVGGSFPGISWQGQKVPEIIWLCFIADYWGRKKAVELSLEYCRIVLNEFENKMLSPFLISSYEQISDEECEKIKLSLIDADIYNAHLDSLKPFLSIFPKCPLYRILEIDKLEKPNITKLKEKISELSLTDSIETVHTFGTIIFSEIYNGRMHVPPQSHLANFEPINDYPDTEESRILASFIRAGINGLFAGDLYNFENKWIKQFWKKSYSYEPSRI